LCCTAYSQAYTQARIKQSFVFYASAVDVPRETLSPAIGGDVFHVKHTHQLMRDSALTDMFHVEHPFRYGKKRIAFLWSASSEV